MMSGKIINIKGAGDVLLERSRRSKHINISLRPFKGVRVAVPYGISFARAAEVANAKVKWIKKHLEQMGAVEREATELKKSNHIDREKARKKLVKRLDELSQRYGFKYNRVFIRNQKTRWGSCSAKNNEDDFIRIRPSAESPMI